MTPSDIKQWQEFKAWRIAQEEAAVKSDEYQELNEQLRKLGEEARTGIEREYMLFGVIRLYWFDKPDADYYEVRSANIAIQMNAILSKAIKYQLSVEGMLDWLAGGKQ